MIDEFVIETKVFADVDDQPKLGQRRLIHREQALAPIPDVLNGEEVTFVDIQLIDPARIPVVCEEHPDYKLIKIGYSVVPLKR